VVSGYHLAMPQGNWQFNEEVAARFTTEAHTHIPNYEAVIQKCVDLALKSFDDTRSAKIIDVGCATGYTIDRLYTAGFSNVYGVDSSKAMLERCRVQERLFHSDSFPKEAAPFDMVLANWTLHFIDERKDYLNDIKESLAPNGMLVLTDKMSSSPLAHEQYYDFKRSMGVTEEEIARKEASIKGVLNTRPLEWYLDTLDKIGFKEINVIDAPYCFATLLAFN
jgi:SAM-dependent methyltransferase